MTTYINLSLLTICFFCFRINCDAQTIKPKIYISPEGIRYTEQQFDSIKTANMGKPISQMDVIDKENETQITFEVLKVHPTDIFKKKWIGKVMPAFALRDIQGKSYTNKSLAGKIVVINFWSTTCVPCLKEMPLLSDLVSKYTGKGVIFIAPAPESATQVKRMLVKRRFTYNVLPQAKELFSALGIEAYPFHFVIDEQGVIKDVYSGSTVNPQTNEAIVDNRLVSAIEALTEKHR